MRLPYRKESEGGMAWPRLRDRMDRLFQSVFDPFTSSAGWAPDVDVRENDREIEVRAEIPGMEPSEFQISVKNDTLTIAGEKREERRDEQGGIAFSEIRYGAFQRDVPLPDGADPDRVDAAYDKGVLKIKIGKKAGVAPRRVPVKAAPQRTDGEEDAPSGT